MKLKSEQKQKLKITVRLLYLCLILFPLLCAATYTWFRLSKTPKVSDMEYSVSSGTGMELAFDPQSSDEEWTQFLDFSEVQEQYAPLKPVTWSDENQCFFAAEYGIDGRIIGITRELSDEENANRNDAFGYYIKETFYARTGEPVHVSLTPPTAGVDETEGAGTYLIGTPIWDSESVSHDNGGLGFEYAIRVGIRITKLEEDGVTLGDDSVLYIYEPNCDSHVAAGEENAPLVTITDDVESIEFSTPSIDGTAQLIDEMYLIRQTTSSWSEADPVQRAVVIQEMGEFLTDTWLFDLDADEIAQIDLYIWLEGQDVDCNNLIGQQKAQLFMNFQFSAEAENGSGLETIQ